MAGTKPRRSMDLNERRESLELPMQQPDESDDEYAMAAMGISDGFRPMNGTIASQYQPTLQYTNSTNTIPSSRRSAASATSAPRPSSASKPKQADSFALRHDGAMGHVNRNSSANGGSSSTPMHQTQPSSASLNSGLYSADDDDEEVYRGPTQPSQAYQAYAQDSTAHRVSLATTVLPSERSYRGPTGPTHPYGMYPQNTAPESSSGRGPPEVTIVPGFPGRNNDYQRRLGPDGEEAADIIGPDGHTEQLPPYTKYADEALARKARMASVSAPIEGAGGMGLATRNPEFSSREDLSMVQSRNSVRSASTRQEAASTTDDAEAGPSEKKEMKKWQKIARKKICGIVPLWALILAITTLVLFVVILVVTLYVLGKEDYPSTPTKQPAAATTATYDAIPLTTIPPNLPTLPTGTFALPIAAPSAIRSSCLLNTEQSKAWSCSIPDSPLQMEIRDAPSAANKIAKKEIILDYGSAKVTEWPFGTQPPVLNDAYPMSLVTDLHDSARGPAWFFLAVYNKVVVVPEDLLSSPYDRKRDLRKPQGQTRHQDELPSSSDFLRRNVAEVGSTPWFCYWNGTLLEGFIYVNQTSSEAGHAAAHASLGQATTTTAGSATKTTGFNIATPTQTSIFDDGRWGREHEMLSAYPKVLKIIERRIPEYANTIDPYCKKRFIAADGTAQDVRNSTGGLVIVHLNETMSDTLDPMRKRSMFDEEVVVEEKIVERNPTKGDNSCGCIWLGT